MFLFINPLELSTPFWQTISIKTLLQCFCFFISMTLTYVKFHKYRVEAVPVGSDEIGGETDTSGKVLRALCFIKEKTFSKTP